MIAATFREPVISNSDFGTWRLAKTRPSEYRLFYLLLPTMLTGRIKRRLATNEKKCDPMLGDSSDHHVIRSSGHLIARSSGRLIV